MLEHKELFLLLVCGAVVTLCGLIPGLPVGPPTAAMECLSQLLSWIVGFLGRLPYGSKTDPIEAWSLLTRRVWLDSGQHAGECDDRQRK